MRVKAGARPLARWAFRLRLPWGQRGTVGKAAHGLGSGRAGGGRSRLPLGSRHRPSVAARPPALDVLKPHQQLDSSSCVGGVAGEVGGERVGCWAPVAPIPVLRSGPGPWIPWFHSWPWVLISARGSRAQGKPSALGEGCIREKRKDKERNPLQHTWGAGGGRQTEEPSSQRKVCGGVSFKVT